MEVIYLLVAVVIGWVLYRFFSGHGGIKISRKSLAGLPTEGAIEVRGAEVRWSSTGDDDFAAAWALSSGHWVAIRVTFRGADDGDEVEDMDLGQLDLSVSERKITSGAGWTDQILDRGLRADVEAVLKALAGVAKLARSDRTRAATAKSVGVRKELD